MVPYRLARNVESVYGASGSAWLRRLRHLVAESEGRWSLSVQTPYTDLTYNYVTPAVTTDG